MRRRSEESIRTEDCDGPIPDILMEDPTAEEGKQGSKVGQGEALCSDRAELIERIKRGESPTWVPNEALKQEYLKNNDRNIVDTQNGRTTEPKGRPPLLPAADFRAIPHLLPDSLQDQLYQPPNIQRPRSALHAGDFAADTTKTGGLGRESPHCSGYPIDGFEDRLLGASPTTPCYTTPSSIGEVKGLPRYSPQGNTPNTLNRRAWRGRAPSLSSWSSSNYILKAPTTPLVQQSNNTDLDFSPRERSKSPDKSNRRRTLPPSAFQDVHFSGQLASASLSARQPRCYRREGNFHPGHHPRRSLTSNWSLQASTSPHTPPYLRSRRTSFSSEASPLQHAHMVGSYEESILRGWMSTAPSKPLDFTAQIGVLGRGKCKPKCPAHVTIPFPAVFYSWSFGNGRNAVNDDPSPYVGHIDLQHSLITPEAGGPSALGEEMNIKPEPYGDGRGFDLSAAIFQSGKTKKRRQSSPSVAPPGGSYRIPQQGQLQLVIKNPNKTAVKLFLVPYDLEGMEPNTKTFVRQKSYSADLVTDSSRTSIPFSEPALLTKKPKLRYLIDLKICSSSKGRFYLYQQIRVVFANRVPDDKEPLRNEVQLPHPKYSSYKPKKDPLSGPEIGAGSRLSVDRACRRGSSGFATGGSARQSPGESPFPADSGPAPPIPAIPLDLAVTKQTPVRRDDDVMELDSSKPTTSDDTQSPLSEKTNCPVSAQLSSSYKNSSSQVSDGYNKLTKGESGYGGLFGRPGTPEPGEGLLARRLKGVGIQRDATLGDYD